MNASTSLPAPTLTVIPPFTYACWVLRREDLPQFTLGLETAQPVEFVSRDGKRAAFAVDGVRRDGDSWLVTLDWLREAR